MIARKYRNNNWSIMLDNNISSVAWFDDDEETVASFAKEGWLKLKCNRKPRNMPRMSLQLVLKEW